MRRFRILFLAVAVVVVVPVGLLVGRAIDSVELERRTRHEAVAERIFDEMERALSELLAREEERPFGQYSHDYMPQWQASSPLVRSPLADPPSLPYVVGYFQIDPDGKIETPLQPSPREDWQPSPSERAVLSELERMVMPHFRDGSGLGRNRAGAAPQLPGTTVTVSDDSPRPKPQENRPAPSRASAFDALRALNKGIEQRAGRQTKTELEYAPALRAAPAPARQLYGGSERDESAQLADAAPAPRSNEIARLEIAPMVGRVIDAHRMLLYRTVVRDAQAYRQGLLLDLDALATWLRAEALGTDGVATYATVALGNPFARTPGTVDKRSGVPFDPAQDRLREPQHERFQNPSNEPDSVRPKALEGPFVYQHRFADPFADLNARLALRPLPGVGGANYVYALCAVVVAAGGLGLLAIYRMVSVTMSYAERRSNFVAAVSHELKTPLTAIHMYGEMLRDGIVPAEAKRAEYYRHITVESERLNRLINNVLEFSQLEKGTRKMPLVTGSLGPVVTEAAELLRPHAEREGFTLDVDVGRSLPVVHFERDALLQVLFNLVDNAVKYARDGDAKRISVSCRLEDGEVHLAVRDHGPGVARHHLRKLFEPFYRGESELTRRNKGSGLGLALVHSLAKEMGARAAARNVDGDGFEVVIVFPTV
jgi:hypothetical protein